MALTCSASFTWRLITGEQNASINFSDSIEVADGNQYELYIWNFTYKAGDPPATGIDAEWISDQPGEPLPTTVLLRHDGFSGDSSRLRKGTIYFRTPGPSVRTLYTLKLWIRQP